MVEVNPSTQLEGFKKDEKAEPVMKLAFRFPILKFASSKLTREGREAKADLYEQIYKSRFCCMIFLYF